MEGGSRPLELILARNLLASLTTAAFLVDGEGEIAYYNDAAGLLIGRRFEETGPLAASEWTSSFGPLDEDGEPIPFDRIGLARTLLDGRPSHDSFCIRAIDGERHPIEASGMPLVGAGGYRGALVVFWPAEEGAR